MDWTLLLVLGLAAGGLGVGAAQACGPLACTWPALSSPILLSRVEALGRRQPGPRRRVAGSLAILILMAAGCTAAYVAAPAAPRSLARQAVAAVIATALGEAPPAPTPAAPIRSKADAPPAPLIFPDRAPGPVMVYSAAPVAPPSAPGVAPASDLAAFQSRINTTPVLAPLNGLTLEQTQRFFALSEKIEQHKVAIRQGLAPPVPFFSDDLVFPGVDLILASVGADAAEYNRYLGVIDEGATAPQRAEVAANPILGPDHLYLPAGADRRATMTKEGVDPRGSWLASLPDAAGGVILRRISVTSGAQQLRDLGQVQAALRDADAIAHGADPAQYGMSAAGAASVLVTMPRSVRTALRR